MMNCGNPKSGIGVSPGKIIRAPFLFDQSRPIVLAPIDDFLLYGPKNGLEQRTSAVDRIVEARPDAVLTFLGTVGRYPRLFSKLPRIVNLSVSTTRSNHTHKLPLAGIESALRLNASAVAYHINITSSSSNRMLSSASTLIQEAERYHLPTIGIIYPRGEAAGADDNHEELRRTDPDSYADLVAHCVAVGADLGFDAIKTQYTGSRETFARVIDASGGVPVLVAGGPLVDKDEALEIAKHAIESGASGVSFGRNLFGRRDPIAFVNRLRTLGDQLPKHKDTALDSAGSPSSATRDGVNDWLQSLISAWEGQRVDAALGLFSMCVDYRETPHSPNAAAVEGGVRQLWEEIRGQSDIKVAAEILSIDHNLATISYRASYRDSGIERSSAGIWFVEFAESQCHTFKQWFMVE